MQYIKVKREGALDWLTLAKPEKLNAICLEMRAELTEYFQGLQHDHECRVVIIQGEGAGFCAGLDLTMSSEEEDASVNFPADRFALEQRKWSDMVKLMRQAPQIVIALIHGPASGVGFAIALAADVRIAGDGARMNAAFIRIGLSGGDCGSSFFLPRIVGATLASEILLTGRFVDARRAQEIGLVSERVADDDLVEAGRKMASDILRNGPLGVRLTKQLLAASLNGSSFQDQVEMENQAQVLACSSGGPEEGARAFLEKRAPNFAR